MYAPHINLQATSKPVLAKAIQDRPLKVVVLGALSKIKGADTLEAVATLARKQGLPLEFHLLGYGYRALRSQPRANLSIHGAYQEADLPELLAWLNADLAWFPAQCPETYSYTLSACLAAGLPVMASDLGALPERLHDRAWTWLVDWQATPSQWVDHLLSAKEALSSPLLNQTPISAHAQSVFLSAVDISRSYLPSSIASAASVHDLLNLALHLNLACPPSPESRPMLHLLYRLRQLPILSTVIKLIPTHFQRRVKSLLLG